MMVTVDILILLNIPMIIFLGIITSYQDFKHNKIKNKWIKFALIYSIISLIVSILLLKYRNEPINLIYIKVFFSNIIISLAVGILLWLSHLWSAGDAKLFLAYTALVPLSMYKWGGNSIFPSFVILVNTFVPAFAVLFIKLLKNIKYKMVLEELKQIMGFNQLRDLTFFMFSISWITQKILLMLNILPSIMTNLIFLLLIYKILKQFLKEKFWLIAIILSITRLVFDNINLTVLILLIKQILLFVLIRLIICLGHYSFSKQIYIEDLKPGMSLAEDILKVKEKYVRKKDVIYVMSQLFIKNAKENSIFSDYRELNEKDVKKINRLHSIGEYKSHVIYIRENIPFAVILFAGVLLTLMFNGNLLENLF